MRETARGVRPGRFARRSSRGTSSSDGTVERDPENKIDVAHIAPVHVCAFGNVDAGVAGRGTRSGGYGDALEAQELVSLVPGQFTAAGDDPAARGRRERDARRPEVRARGPVRDDRLRERRDAFPGRVRAGGGGADGRCGAEDRGGGDHGVERVDGEGRAGSSRARVGRGGRGLLADVTRTGSGSVPSSTGLTERVSRQEQQLFMFPPRWIRDQDFVGSRGDFDRGA